MTFTLNLCDTDRYYITTKDVTGNIYYMYYENEEVNFSKSKQDAYPVQIISLSQLDELSIKNFLKDASRLIKNNKIVVNQIYQVTDNSSLFYCQIKLNEHKNGYYFERLKKKENGEYNFGYKLSNINFECNKEVKPGGTCMIDSCEDGYTCRKYGKIWVGHNRNNPFLKGICVSNDPSDLPESSEDSDPKRIINNHYWEHKECWNANLDSVEPDEIEIELGGSRPGTYQHGSAYRKYGPFAQEDTRDYVIVHACENPKYPFGHYNEAATAHNKKKLDDQYVQNTYFKRNQKLVLEDDAMYDKRSVAFERIRLKDEQIASMSKLIKLFGVMYYAMLFLIVVRLIRSGGLTSNQTLVFIVVGVVVAALPFVVQHVARGTYMHIGPREGFRLLAREEPHHDRDGKVAPDYLMMGQAEAMHQIEGEKCIRLNQYNELRSDIEKNKEFKITDEDGKTIFERIRLKDAAFKYNNKIETNKFYINGILSNGSFVLTFLKDKPYDKWRLEFNDDIDTNVRIVRMENIDARDRDECRNQKVQGYYCWGANLDDCETEVLRRENSKVDRKKLSYDEDKIDSLLLGISIPRREIKKYDKKLI